MAKLCMYSAWTRTSLLGAVFDGCFREYSRFGYAEAPCGDSGSGSAKMRRYLLILRACMGKREWLMGLVSN